MSLPNDPHECVINSVRLRFESPIIDVRPDPHSLFKWHIFTADNGTFTFMDFRAGSSNVALSLPAISNVLSHFLSAAQEAGLDGMAMIEKLIEKLDAEADGEST